MKQWCHKMCGSLGITIILLTITGCATGFNRLYEGAPRAQDQVAYLVTECSDIFFAPCVFIDEVDSKPVTISDWTSRSKCELLPGQHTVKVHFYHDHDDFAGALHVSKQSAPVTLDFQAEAGRTYCVDPGILGLPRFADKWNPRIVCIGHKF